MENFEVYMYTPIHLSYSLDEVPCKFNFFCFDPLPPKNFKKKKKKFKTRMEIWLSKWKVNSGQSTLHTNLEKKNPVLPTR
jgi:hypothetical protein